MAMFGILYKDILKNKKAQLGLESSNFQNIRAAIPRHHAPQLPQLPQLPQSQPIKLLEICDFVINYPKHDLFTNDFAFLNTQFNNMLNEFTKKVEKVENDREENFEVNIDQRVETVCDHYKYDSAYLLHFYLQNRLKEIEDKPNFREKFDNAHESEHKSKLLDAIRLNLRKISLGLTDHIKNSIDTPLLIKLTLNFAKRRLICNERHQIVNENTYNSTVNLNSFKKILYYLFLLLLFYDACVFDADIILRYILYLLQALTRFDSELKDKQFYSIFSDVNDLLESSDASLFKLVVKKGRCTAIGALKIQQENGLFIDYNSQYAFQQLIFASEFDNIIIEPSVNCVHCIESNAAASKYLLAPLMEESLIVTKTVILIVCAGIPEIVLRNFLFIISEKYPRLTFTSDMDCDANGIRMHRILQMGSFQSAYNNIDRTVPRLRVLGLLPHQITKSSGLVGSPLTTPKIKNVLGRITSLLRFHPYTQHFINYLVAIIFNNTLSSLGGSANPQQNLDNFMNYLESHSESQRILEPRDGLPFFQHMEIIDFQQAKEFEVTFDNIAALRIDLPNYVINKCVDILNEK